MEKLDIEETPKEPETKETPVEDKAKALLSELEKFGVANPDQLAGALTAGKEAGRLAQLLGDERKQANRLAEEIKQLRHAVSQKPEVPTNNDGSIDLKSLIRGELRNFYKEDIIAPQQRFNDQFYQEMHEVTSDDDFNIVGEAFQKHITSPQVQRSLYNGATSVKNEYNKTIKAALKGLLGQAAGTLKGLTENRAKPPFMESSDTTIPIGQTSKDKITGNLHKINEARQKGTLSSDEALQQTVNSVLFGKT